MTATEYGPVLVRAGDLIARCDDACDAPIARVLVLPVERALEERE